MDEKEVRYYKVELNEIILMIVKIYKIIIKNDTLWFQSRLMLIE